MNARTAQFDLRGKVVAITGGARGIGLATAKAFEQRGAVVAIGDLDPAATSLAADTIGNGAKGFGLDVTDRESFEAFVNDIEQNLGPIDVLVNNAGIQRVGPFADESDDATAMQVAVNLGGVLTGTKIALARMRPRGSGHIVNVASVAAKVAVPGGATYTATKHAVLGLSESLRWELEGSGIAVSVVMPDSIATDMVAGLGSARGSRRLEPAVVGEAIADAVSRSSGKNVYVPQSTGVMAAATSVMPRRLRVALLRLAKADTVLTNVDHSARAKYDAGLSTRHNLDQGAAD